jgi:hypothetical protein
MSDELLRQIARQLATSSLTAAPNVIGFQVRPSDVTVKTCWFKFVGIFLNLILGLFRTLMNQWIRAYVHWMEVTPEANAVFLR